MTEKNIKKRIKVILLIILFILFFGLLFILSSLGGLRFFIPHYFNIAGSPFSEKNYLILYQNNNELMPSGGRIAAYGIAKFNNGFFAGIDLKESENVFKDNVNNYADYPKTVPEIANKFKETDKATKIDGVIAINKKVIDDAREIINNVDLNKIFLSPLKWRDISDMVTKNLNEKHILLYFYNSGLQNSIDEKNWGGKWPTPKGDFLSIVETNLSGSGADRYIKRSAEYRLKIEKNANADGYKLTGKLRIIIENFGDDNEPTSKLNAGYLQVFLANGVKLKTSNPSVIQEKSDDYTVFGNSMTINPKERRIQDYTFELPENIFDGKIYHLDLIKQPGTLNDYYSVIIEAPQGVLLKSNDFEIRENYAIFEGDLLKDKSFSLDVFIK